MSDQRFVVLSINIKQEYDKITLVWINLILFTCFFCSVLCKYLKVLSKYCDYWSLFKNGLLAKNILRCTEIKFDPEVKKSLNEFHWTVLSMSDLSDHKDSLCSQWKSRGLEILPTNFWQFKAVHNLALRTEETQTMVSRMY